MSPRKTSLDTYKALLEELKSGDIKPVYYWYGEESFFIDRLQEAIEQHVPVQAPDFNFDIVYGREHNPNDVLDICRSYPMMSDKRIVIVRDVLQLADTPADVAEQEDESSRGAQGTLNDFIPYLEQPNPNTVLILTDQKSPDGRSKLGKALKKNKNIGVDEFKPIPDYKLADWVIDWARLHYDKTIRPDAAELLTQHVGNSLLLLSTEIDKLCTYQKDEKELSIENVKKIIGLYRQYTVFELKDAVMRRDLEQSWYIAEQMLQHAKNESGEVIKTTGFFYKLFSNVWQINYLKKKGKSKQQVGEELGLKGYYFENLWKEASYFRLKEMPRIFEALLDADRAAKGMTTMDSQTVYLFLIRRIIG